MANRKYNLDNYDISRDEFEHLVNQYVFNELYRDIFLRRMLDGITYESLAEEFNFSRNQIVNIINKCSNKVFKRMRT